MNSSMIPLGTPLSGIQSINSRFISKLEKLGIRTVRDLLWHFPVRYEDFSEVYQIADLAPGQYATVQGVIEDVRARRSWQRRLNLVEAALRDNSGTIRIVWFNQPYIKNILHPGQLANISGKVSRSSSNELYFSHPSYEPLKSGGHEPQHTMHTARLVPVYPETKGLTSRGIRFLIEPLLAQVKLHEWIPEEIIETQHIPEIRAALQKAHFPDTLEEAEQAKKRFAFEDLFLLQLMNFRQKIELGESRAEAIAADISWLKKILEELPFNLTESQKRSLWEIVKDMGRTRPMNRLLQGDVGSGKTVVAALAGLIAAHRDFQTAFMAPTEVLARQHFKTLKELLGRLSLAKQPALGLLVGKEAKVFYENDIEADVTKAALLKQIKSGEVRIVAGTHALIQKSVTFKQLALAVVDEQHRFGVRERAALLSHGANGTLPHFLSMSATPIPRTLMLTVFGDLDASQITELPAGRKRIITKIVGAKDREATYRFIKKKVEDGRQVFVVCPRIEEQTDASSGKASSWHYDPLLDAKSVKKEYERLSKKIFPELRISMLHGKMKPQEKERVMNEFRGGKADILVSTSVIEVGVDVANAAIMMIEGSERFGLAQLYQFRGRVGRGAHQSYCFLMTESETKSARERLEALVKARNGFELAEYDLRLRGPGEFLGTSQTGLPDLAMRSLQNPELINVSRAAAKTILEKDYKLTNRPHLKAQLEQFESRVHNE